MCIRDSLTTPGGVKLCVLAINLDIFVSADSDIIFFLRTQFGYFFAGCFILSNSSCFCVFKITVFRILQLVSVCLGALFFPFYIQCFLRSFDGRKGSLFW